MTRIIGGVAGSLKLSSPAKVTRPTSDRVRESIFNRLESRDLIENATVLDLYAGTGALGLEAISRGAKELVMVEKDSKAAKVCSANAQLVSKNPVGEMSVIAQPVQAFLNASTSGKLFDLIFIDPPYEVSNDDVTRNLEALLAHLNQEALIMLERSSRDQQPKLPEGYELDDVKSYGDTTVYWISRN